MSSSCFLFTESLKYQYVLEINNNWLQIDISRLEGSNLQFVREINSLGYIKWNVWIFYVFDWFSWLVHSLLVVHGSLTTLSFQLFYNFFMTCSWLCSWLVHEFVHDLFMTWSWLAHGCSWLGDFDFLITCLLIVHNLFMPAHD